LSSLHHASERDQELLRHRVLQMSEEATKVKAYEFEKFQTAKDMEIHSMQEELEEEVQDHRVPLANRDNIIDNLQSEIHEL
jgi:hypothetical protein